MSDALPPYEPYPAYEDAPADAAPPPKPEVWGGWATFGFGLVILIVTMLIEGAIGAIVLAGFIVADKIPLNDLNAFMDLFQQHAGVIVAVSVVVNAVVGTALMYLIVRGRHGLRFFDYLGFRRFTLRALLYSLVAFGVYFGLTVLVENLAGTTDSSTLGFNFYDTSTWPVLVWAAVCLIGPLYEEMWVRGFMFAGFIRSSLAVSGTLVVTSLFWAVQHVQYSWLPIMMIFVFGLALGYIRWKSNSIWPSFIVHALNNTIALALLTQVH